uniref:Uncharacterized protein n=1 Tax=Oryza brachyantha TaxID=4533 RepID=J3LM83_ORYBR
LFTKLFHLRQYKVINLYIRLGNVFLFCTWQAQQSKQFFSPDSYNQFQQTPNFYSCTVY